MGLYNDWIVIYLMVLNMTEHSDFMDDESDIPYGKQTYL